MANDLQNACDEQSYGNRADEDIPKRGNCEQEDQRGSDGEEQPWKIPAHGQPVHRNAAMWRFRIHHYYCMPLLLKGRMLLLDFHDLSTPTSVRSNSDTRFAPASS